MLVVGGVVALVILAGVMLVVLGSVPGPVASGAGVGVMGSGSGAAGAGIIGSVTGRFGDGVVVGAAGEEEPLFPPPAPELGVSGRLAVADADAAGEADEVGADAGEVGAVAGGLLTRPRVAAAG